MVDIKAKRLILLLNCFDSYVESRVSAWSEQQFHFLQSFQPFNIEAHKINVKGKHMKKNYD